MQVSHKRADRAPTGTPRGPKRSRRSVTAHVIARLRRRVIIAAAGGTARRSPAKSLEATLWDAADRDARQQPGAELATDAVGACHSDTRLDRNVGSYRAPKGLCVVQQLR